MKKLIVLLLVCCFTNMCFASYVISDENNAEKLITLNTTENKTENGENPVILKDCTVRLDFTLEDGTTIKGEITFVDVSWWDCSKMQLAAWWKRNF